MSKLHNLLGGAALAALAPLCGAATPGAFVADAAHSKLEFVGVQAGAEFTGVFHRFSATIDFSPDALGAAHFDVQIDMNSLDSMDKDRDATLRGADLFDVAHAASSHYVTRTITKTANGYSAQGTLTLRGVSRDVPIDFQFTPAAAGGATLKGSATLKRLDFGVGQGEWKSTEWVANAVKVNFTLTLKPRN